MNPQREMLPFRSQEKILIEKIRMLPMEKVTEIENFVDFLSYKVRHSEFLQATNKLSEEVFQKVWDNPEDDAYNDL